MSREVGIDADTAGASPAGPLTAEPSDAGAPSRARAPRPALLALAASIGLLVATAALGPSAVEPPLPGAGRLPPYAATGLHPAAGLVLGLLVAAVGIGALGLAGALRALARGWRPRWQPLVAAALLAVAALALVPPIGSADPESYAAYGHLAVTGHDPYRTSPAEVAQRFGDPVAAAVEAPWQRTASVYGPIATAEQAAAARIGGDSVRTAVAVLQWWSALAFVLTGLLLLRLAPDDRARRWVALGWWCNPLLLLALVAGAHVDALVALGVVAAVALVQRPGRLAAPAAGVALGCAAGVKLPALIVGAGLCWALRRRPARAALLVAGVAAVLLPAYAVAGRHALDQTRTAARFASRGTPWRWLASGLDHAIGQPSSRIALGAIAVAATLALLWLLLRRVPPERPAVAALAAYAAYLLAAPYALPWYDATAWALLACTAATTARRPVASWWVALLLARTAALSAAYLTRDVPLPGAVTTAVDALRGGLAPVVVAAVIVVTVTRTARRS
ncbi:MAG: hypothetical protein ACJ74O_11435 [Frankiaceae bacterium]